MKLLWYLCARESTKCNLFPIIFMKKSIKALLLSFAAMFLAVSAYSQVTTASMSGKVTDSAGPVVGAAVVAVLRYPALAIQSRFLKM